MRNSVAWILVAVLAGAALFSIIGGLERSVSTGPELGSGNAEIIAAFEGGVTGVMVEGSGRVIRLLPDDRDGSPHQRFIVELEGGHTLLISHNLDLAERVPLRIRDVVSFHGRYEWNDQGGVVHWTHDDPTGRREGGWIKLGDTFYR